MNGMLTREWEKAEQAQLHKHTQGIHSWTTRRDEKKRRMQMVSSWMTDAILRQDKMVEALEALIAPTDRIVLEGDNQKQADFLSRSLVKADPRRLHGLHLIILQIRSHLSNSQPGNQRLRNWGFEPPSPLGPLPRSIRKLHH